MTTNDPTPTTIDTVVIGGGQTGLSVGHHLQRAGRSFVILDAGERVGDAWRNRWDSLLLFTPARLNGLPGYPFPDRRDAFITKDQMADYLEDYAARFDLPVRLGTRVERVSRHADGFETYAGQHLYRSRNVVVATSSFGQPRIPGFAAQLDPEIAQLHSLHYRRAEQLPAGPVLVVGVGNSGADITMELSRTHDVLLAGEPIGAVPFRIERYIARHLLVSIVFLVQTHVLNLGTPIGRKVLRKTGGAPPLIRVKPKDLARAAAARVPRVTGVEDGKPVTEDGTAHDVASVIWCTGFRPSFPWLDLPVLGDGGEPRHVRGVVESEPGLYFCGLLAQYAASSDTIVGVQRDVRWVMRHLLRTRPPLAVPARGAATDVGIASG